MMRDAQVATLLPPSRRRAPALQAALIQLIVALPVFGGWLLANAPIPLVAVALVQGAMAAVVTDRCRMAPWWRLIQFAFPLAIVAARALHLPSIALLSAFVLLLLLFWSTFQTQVPLYPSGRAVWESVAELLPRDRPVRVIDIGSGLGGFVLNLARSTPQASVCGIEVAPLPWLVSSLRARLTSSSARFLRGDYERLDFADYDVVFAYLSPAAMSALWEKAQREMRPATMLVSYEFTIPAKPPDRTIATTALGPPVFVWNFSTEYRV
jgi:SAM-dependent methyltransferase